MGRSLGRMYGLVLTASARKSLKRLSRRGRFDKEEFDVVVRSLCRGEVLSQKYKDHQLKGDMSMSRECHISFDLLVLYRVYNAQRVLSIEDVGTHDELFG